MSAFDEASLVETRAIELAMPLIQQMSHDGRYVLTNKGNLAKELQKTAGDVMLNTCDGRIWGIEIKGEEENKHNNFFLETWSNLSRFTPGWMLTLKTDILLYCFIKEKDLYSMGFNRLRTWAFTQRRIYDFQEKPQGKYAQMNDTWGRCVPIQTIGKEVGFTRYLLEEGIYRKAS